ncbi:transcriptional regulator [Halioglobus japonicus]|uniref:Probable transcriptional regulatory protein C0029_08205 n=1 Tax=Halioglobus japonicus TaxID=930805 RepID=A0AAP8MEJ9_9GAMM|nr:YebC/PmpR family DNA-binding transcriptional regulator [Halioglobus japonicus]AQA18379.1 transcriptional regulator [Halioglobus japonicus]PLW86395.1 YebC/PmpR family DNA-binding transcriptional regulator [Halioglobus japonicus]GHD13101.1 putative transcriptional regulatory protein [Halioglobus japonicus]
MGRAYQNRKESMAKTSDQKARVYSKHARVIYVTAKQGGIDPDGNLALRSAIDRAKRDQVPAHVIDKAIDKAKGGSGEDFAPARYEGFGPGGCMVIVDCLTDNPNRTIGDVRVCFTKTKAKLGTPGSVSHSFDHSAIFVFPGDDEEAALEALMMADVEVEDIECEDGKITVFAPHTEFAKVRQALTEAFEGIEFEVEEIQFVPKETASIPADDEPMFEKFLDMLNDVEDVQKVYHNVG